MSDDFDHPRKRQRGPGSRASDADREQLRALLAAEIIGVLDDRKLRDGISSLTTLERV